MGFLRRTVPIFRSLEEAEFAAIAKLIIHKDYDKGEIIFHEGDNFVSCDRARRIDQDL